MRTVLSSLEHEVARYKRLLQSFMGNAIDVQSFAYRLTSFFDVLNQTGIVDNQVLLGEEFLGMPYSPVEGGSDSGVCYQAAILMPHGIGVLLMDTDTRYELSRIPEGIEANSNNYFVPIQNCKPVIQQWLRPQLDGLVRKLLATVSSKLAATSRIALPMVTCGRCTVRIEVVQR